MKIGFDNDKYLKEQSEEIRRRAGRYGRLYLEFGGKLFDADGFETLRRQLPKLFR